MTTLAPKTLASSRQNSAPTVSGSTHPLAKGNALLRQALQKNPARQQLRRYWQKIDLSTFEDIFSAFRPLVWPFLACGFAYLVTTIVALNFAKGSTQATWASLVILAALLPAFVLCSREFFTQLYADWRQSRLVGAGSALIIALLGETVHAVWSAVAQPLQFVHAPWHQAHALAFAGLVLLLAGARLVNRYVARRSIFSLKQMIPQVRLADPRQFSENAAPLSAERPAASQLIPIEAIGRGDVIELRAGDLVPCDGLVLMGGAEIRERRLSFLSTQRVITEGTKISAGSVILSGAVYIEADAPFAETPLSLLINAYGRVGKEEPKEWQRGVVAFAASIVCLAVFGLGLEIFRWYQFSGGVVPGRSLAAAGILAAGGVVWILLSRSAQILEARLFSSGIHFSRDILPQLAKVNHLVLSPGATLRSAEVTATRFELLDERVDEASLVSVLLSVLGKCQGEFYQRLAGLIRGKIEAVTPYTVDDFLFYDGLGFSAIVHGTEVTVGIEHFLIERGVPLQNSELTGVKESEEILFVALESDVVARIVLAAADPASDQSVKATEQLRHAGVRVMLWGGAAQSELDGLGRAIGIELADIQGGLSEDQVAEKFLSYRPVALYASREVSPEVVSAAEVSFADLITDRWNVDGYGTTGSDVKIVESGYRGVAQAIVSAKSWARAYTLSLGLWASLTLFALAFLILSPTPVSIPYVCVAALIIFATWNLFPRSSSLR